VPGIRSALAVVALLASVPIVAPSTDAAASAPAPVAAASIALPPTTGAFDYQLGGSYPPPPGVTIVARDSTAKPASGIYSICYVNGFQTQPGTKWPKRLLVSNTRGTPLVDPGWPDEHLIDISTAANRRTAAARIARATDRCARTGFQAVEFDNLDSYSRSHGSLTLQDAVAFAKLLVSHAHAVGLAAA
jgi:hypothetical protein